MNNEGPFFIHYNYLRDDKMYIPYKTLNYSINLLKDALRVEKEEEYLYDYLLSLAPSAEEKNIIESIRDDSIKHKKFLEEIYNFYKEENITYSNNITFEKPTSYIDALKRGKLDELSEMERYRDIMAGIPHQFYKDMIFEILTDELKHSAKYDYLLYLNLEKQLSNQPRNIKTRKKHFTENDAYLIAKVLGVDFNKEKFDVEQFRMGIDVELEHGKVNELTNVTDDDAIRTGKIVLAHLIKFPDYYIKLAKMEEEAVSSLAAKLAD